MLNYLLAILFASTLGFGMATYHLTGKLAVAVEHAERLQKLAAANVEAVERAVDSCKITLKTIDDTQKAVDALNESRNNDLSALKDVTHITLPETHINGTTKPTAPDKAADDLRLSPDTMRLLDNAYCSGAKADPYCTAR